MALAIIVVAMTSCARPRVQGPVPDCTASVFANLFDEAAPSDTAGAAAPDSVTRSFRYSMVPGSSDCTATTTR